ncbi:MAG: tetratricopeptide repeat protein, partial [Ferruginibacter sp.]
DAQKRKDKVSEAIALANIAYDYRALGNTEKSFTYDLEAVSIATSTGNEQAIANTTINLAHNYKDQAAFPKAIDLYKSAAEISIKINDYLVQEWAFSNLGELYLQMGKLDSALMYSQRSYEICLKIKDKEFSSSVLKFLGAIQGKMGNKALAISYFDMSIKQAYEDHSLRWINEAYTALSRYYYEAGQIDSAILYAKKALAIVKNTSFSNKSIHPAKLLLDIYENTNSDSAIKYFKIYRAANDSMFSAKTIQQTQALTFENELRQQEVAAEKIKAEEQRKQNIQFVLIALGIITLISLYLLLSRSFITNTKFIEFFGVVALLIVFEFFNLLLHPFLERVTHHSPILMLLALVCIAALLVPLHHRVEKWATAKLVEKNKQIRLAAAKKTIEQLERNEA